MRNRSLPIIFLSVFIDLFGFGIVLPLLPRYAEAFGAKGMAIGFIVASFSLMQFFFAPWWGRLSDRIGRRPVILISNAGAAVSYLMFAVASMMTGAAGLWLLLASRVFGGLCGANLSVASAYIADVTPPERRSQGMGLIGLAFGLGFILGPAVGAFSAAQFGLPGPGWVASAVCLANFVLGYFILAESRKPTAPPNRPRPKLAHWAETLARPQVGLLVGIYFLATFCFAAFETTLPLLLGSPAFHPADFSEPVRLAHRLTRGDDVASQSLRLHLSPGFKEQIANSNASPARLRVALFREMNRLLPVPGILPDTSPGSEGIQRSIREGIETAVERGGNVARRNRERLERAYPGEIRQRGTYYDETSMGYLFAYCGLISAFIQGGLIGRLVKRFGEERLIFGSLLLVAGSLVLIPYALSLGLLLVALGLFAAGSSINRPPTMGLISINAPVETQGATLGVAQSAGTVARIVGPIFATGIYALRPHSPYWICAVIALAAALLARRYLCPPARR